MNIIYINEIGEAIAPRPDAKEDDEMGIANSLGKPSIGTHWICEQNCTLVPVTTGYNAIACEGCNLRLIIPGDIRTFKNLRNHFKNFNRT